MLPRRDRPSSSGEQAGRYVHLLQLRALAKVVAHFVAEIVAGIGFEIVRLLRVDDAVQHERVERIERAAHNDVFVGLLVAIGDPLLTPASHAVEVVVVAAAPDGVRIAQPEGRGLGSGGEIDEDVRFLLAQPLDEVNGRREIAVKQAAGKHSAGVAGAVELELVDAVLCDHVEAGLLEQAVVFGRGEREAAVHGFVAGLFSGGDALLLCRADIRPTARATRLCRSRTEAAASWIFVKPFGRPALKCHSVVVSSQPSSNRNESSFTPRLRTSSSP